MSRPAVEMADILHAQGDRFLEKNRSWLSFQQVNVLRAITRCRTAALGGHIDSCPRCGHQAISYIRVEHSQINAGRIRMLAALRSPKGHDYSMASSRNHAFSICQDLSPSTNPIEHAESV